jgi:hypothetical protein
MSQEITVGRRNGLGTASELQSLSAGEAVAKPRAFLFNSSSARPVAICLSVSDGYRSTLSSSRRFPNTSNEIRRSLTQRTFFLPSDLSFLCHGKGVPHLERPLHGRSRDDKAVGETCRGLEHIHPLSSLPHPRPWQTTQPPMFLCRMSIQTK